MVSRRAHLLAAIAWMALLLVSAPAVAQVVQDSDEGSGRIAEHETHLQMAASTPYKNAWQFIGPEIPVGRVTDMEVHPSAPETIYMASCAGGVWKSTNDGVNWTPIFENHASSSIGDLAIAPSNPDIIWVGTGESNIFRSSMAGSGVYKSTDAGQTFQYMGLADTQHVGRILVHPTNPDVVYVAGCGNEYKHNETRGVFKTTNGGETWEKVFYHGPDVGVIDLTMDPSEPDTLYAGTAERRRLRWNDPLPGPQSGIHKTTDGGQTWVPLVEGLPDFSSGEYERVGLDVCSSQPNVVYTVLFHAESQNRGAEVYRSNDKGATWARCAGDYVDEEGNATGNVSREFPAYGWVFGQIRVDPSDPETVYVLGLGYSASYDGGATFTRMRGSHSDYHAMWINPDDSNHVLVGNDGGLMVSHDKLESYERGANLPISTPFNVAISQSEGKFWVYGCFQDSSGYRGLVDVSSGRDSVTWMTRWERAPGDEAGRQAVDPTDPTIVYSVRRYGGGPSVNQVAMEAGQGGTGRGRGRGGLGAAQQGTQREGRRGRGQRGGGGDAGGGGGDGDAGGDDQGGDAQGRGRQGRGQRRGQGGDQGDAQGGDAQQGDAQQGQRGQRGQRRGRGQGRGQGGGGRGGRGGPALDFGDERKRAQWVAPLVISPHDPKRVFFGAQMVFVTDDGGENWNRISPDLTNYEEENQGNIQHAVLFAISESPVTKGVIYAGSDDGAMHVTRDGGENWTDISAGLPEGQCVSSIEACHFDEGTVYATVTGRRHDDFETYVFKSTDFGGTWESIGDAIPGSSANVVRQDPANQDILFVGTDKNVYVSTDGGAGWNVLGSGLPTVYVHDLAIQKSEDYAVIATHGRGCWVLDIRGIRGGKP